MDRGEIIKMNDDMKVQEELKRFISKPVDDDFRIGHGCNDYKGDMHRFYNHAQCIIRDMLVSHAEYLVKKIDDDLKAKGIK